MLPHNYAAGLSADQKKLLQVLVDAKQEHIFRGWPAGREDDVQRFFAQVAQLDKKYPGGLTAYAENARRLLGDQAAGVNPFAGMRPEVPLGEQATTESAKFAEMEAVGMENIGKLGFVLVAGGLGERLGYHGIKVALPIDLLTETIYLEHYIEYILAFQAHARRTSGDDGIVLPLAIMTSDDTNDKTAALLNEHSNYGMAPGQITIIRQEKVPALVDNDAHFAIAKDDPFEIVTKPHGHGDVHSLMHLEHVVSSFLDRGIKYVCFFQDTNAIVFHGIPTALGITVSNGFDVNSVCVPRKAGEAAGGICRLIHETDPAKSITVNVEYNQLDPLLRATVNPEGDVGDEQGFSPYPGNINCLIFALESYARVLEQTGGQISEFVNPKYADAEKTRFVKPTRLECMLQDYPKLLSGDARVGFSTLDRWICFSAVKNNTDDAAKKAAKGLPAECAATGEQDLFALHARLLAANGIKIESAEATPYLDIPVSLGPALHLAPSFACSKAALKARFAAGSITARSCLVVEGDVTIDELHLDGTLVVRAPAGTRIHIKALTVRNKGWQYKPLGSSSVKEYLAIRGYHLDKSDADARVITASKSGATLVVDGDSETVA